MLKQNISLQTSDEAEIVVCRKLIFDIILKAEK